MKRGLVLGAVFLLGLGALFLSYRHKTQTQHQPRNVLRTNLMREIITFDPRIADDSDSLQMDYWLYAGLTSLDEKGNAKLDLAESYTLSEDQKSYVFTLKDAHWSDGSPLTAYDFEESWKEYCSEQFPASLWQMVSMIENNRNKKEDKREAVGIRAVDAKTVAIQLEYPISYFLQLLAHPALFPVHHSMRGSFQQNRRIDPAAIVCSGPFKIGSYRDNFEIALEKNPHYHNASRIALEGIHLSRVTDAQTTLALFEKGELDWLGLPLSELPLDALPALQKKGLLGVHPLLDSRFLYFNTQKYPLTNVNLRKALTLAINREAIIKDVMHAGQIAALGYVPFAQKQEEWHPYFKDHDESLARELFQKALEELHIASADALPEIVLSYNTSDMWRRVMQAIQEQWRQVLGISVKLENADWQIHMDRLRRGHYQIARCGRTADFVDSLAFLQALLSFNTGQNFCRWENGEYDKLILSSERVRSLEERRECLEKAERLMMEEMPIAPLMYFTAYSLAREDLKGVVVSPLYYVDFSKAYFDKKT